MKVKKIFGLSVTFHANSFDLQLFLCSWIIPVCEKSLVYFENILSVLEIDDIKC